MRRNIDSVFGILKDITGVVWQKPERVKLGTGEPLISLNAEMRIIKINTDNPHWLSIITQHCDHDETAVRIGLIEAICRDNNVVRADINLDVLNAMQTRQKMETTSTTVAIQSKWSERTDEQVAC